MTQTRKRPTAGRALRHGESFINWSTPSRRGNYEAPSATCSIFATCLNDHRRHFKMLLGTTNRSRPSSRRRSERALRISRLAEFSHWTRSSASSA